MNTKINKTVCILTAGKGSRMGQFSKYINKALLPLDGKAIISHLINKFPSDTEFIIAVGYMGDQVRNYVEIAHNDRNIKFIQVDNYDGEGSGPAYSLSCCKEYLNKPFYYVSCDTLWNNNLDLELNEDWIGVSKVTYEESIAYCNMKVVENHIVDLQDKKFVDPKEYEAFVGLCYIKNYENFWLGLENRSLVDGEFQVSNGIRELINSHKPLAYEIDWLDVGSSIKYENAVKLYEKYDFSKPNEVLYFVNGKVIKFFADESITEKRVKKSKLVNDVFPEITYHKNQFYAYNYCNGETLYTYNNIEVFSKLLKWLNQNLWHKVDVKSENMTKICEKFYKDKTYERLNMYFEKYNVNDEESIINGNKVTGIKKLLEKLPWDYLCQGLPTFMHGDLHFENMLYNRENDSFVLLDWRQEFGGNVEFGDIYYDLAKLYGGIILNYDYIRMNLFTYEEINGKIFFDYTQRYSVDNYTNILHSFVTEKGLDFNKVKLLVPIIYLNMAPLHTYPFDKMLYSMARIMLSQILE